MKPDRRSPVSTPSKSSTGIAGFDEITGGGLPRGRTTLVLGGPGSGKTVLALQFLVHGARQRGEPGIFVAFEEASQRITENAKGFGWRIPELLGKKLFFIDAQPRPDLIQSGDFDLGGMLAALEAKIAQIKARRIVFDALDIVLSALPDLEAKKREVLRLHEWLLARDLTGIITAKAAVEDAQAQSFGFMQFIVDCAVILGHGVVQGASRRSVRVLKYRGSTFDEDESSFRIGKHGIEVSVARKLGHAQARVSNERVSSGVKHVDAMLGGGYYRGTSVLITGSAGTGKTTLSGTFAEAACRRGERTLFVSFDSDGPEVMRNLTSVGIGLERHAKRGLLRMVSARSIAGSADTYMARIKALAIEHRARCVVIDPVSAWSQPADDAILHSVADRVIDWAKSEGITLLCTRLVGDIAEGLVENAPKQISALVDTWIHVDYKLMGGERNRGLSVIKSRGTAHSNQVRELMLSSAGVTLADAYAAGGNVLMGTLRWEKECDDRAESDAKKAELGFALSVAKNREAEQLRRRARMRQLRGADTAPPDRE